jgi:hypothetical protein
MSAVRKHGRDPRGFSASLALTARFARQRALGDGREAPQ